MSGSTANTLPERRRPALPSTSGRTFSTLLLVATAISACLLDLDTRKAAAAEPVAEKIRQIVSDHLRPGDDRFAADTTFLELGADELDLVEIIMALEQEFGIEIPDEDAERIGSLEHAVAYVRWGRAGRTSPKPELGELVAGSWSVGALGPAAASTAPQSHRRPGGTATRRLPRPRPSPPAPLLDDVSTKPTARAEPTPGTEPTTPTKPPVPTPPEGELVADEELREAYVAALAAYYAAVEKQNRVDESSFAQLDAYNAWALENRQRVIERQQLAATVVLIVVVLLVLAGMVFSAIQFWIAMRHARLGKTVPATTLKASLTSVEVSSSVLGVIILVISLLFFYLYLDRVFNLAVLPG